MVAISCVLRSREGLQAVESRRPRPPEGELVQRFFDGIEKFSPDLVSWNGSGFDLPVLHLPGAARRGAGAALLGDRRRRIRAFRYNNYLSRYHWRHTDLMDVLSGFQNRGRGVARQHGVPAGAAGQARLLRAARCGMPGWPAISSASAATARPTCSTPSSSTCASSCCAASSRPRSYAEEIERVKALLRGAQRAAPRRIPARLGGGGVSAAARAGRGVRDASAGLTHEGEGVVRGGKTAFVAGALPGERIRFRRTRRHRQHDDGRAARGAGTLRRACRAALRALRRLRRLRPAAPGAGGAARGEAGRAARRRSSGSARVTPAHVAGAAARARSGATGAARAWARSSCARRAAWWSDFASAPHPTWRSSTRCEVLAPPVGELIAPLARSC